MLVLSCLLFEHNVWFSDGDQSRSKTAASAEARRAGGFVLRLYVWYYRVCVKYHESDTQAYGEIVCYMEYIPAYIHVILDIIHKPKLDLSLLKPWRKQ